MALTDVFCTMAHTLPRRAHTARGLTTALLASGALAAAAAPAQAAPQWAAPQTLSPPGYDGAEQQVSLDRKGDAVAVWSETEPPNDTILASAQPAGGGFSSPQTLSQAGQNAHDPQVATDVQGDAVAVWLRYDGTHYRVQAAYRPAGGAFGTPQTLSQAGVEAEEPRVAMNDSGEAVAVWDISVAGKQQIQAALAAPGGVFGGPSDLTGLTGIASMPQVAIDAHGNAIAVWEGWDGANDRVEAALRPEGASFGVPQYLSPAGANSESPALALDAAGDALAVWSYDALPASTIQGAYRPAGGGFGVPQTIPAPNTEPAQTPQVAFDGDGEGVVAWQQSDGAEASVYASVRVAGAGGAFSTPQTLSADGSEAYEPRVAGDGESGTIVSWKTFDGITNYTVASARPRGGNFSAAMNVSPAGPELSTPEVGIDAQGNGIAVYSRAGGGGEYLVEAALYDGEEPPHGPTSVSSTNANTAAIPTTAPTQTDSPGAGKPGHAPRHRSHRKRRRHRRRHGRR